MMPAKLERKVFQTSRALDFFNLRELETQTGHRSADWGLVMLKECIDNSLDASEESGCPPSIVVTVDNDGLSVADNGPGIPLEAVAGICDYGVRASSREAYCSPSRGAQGNAWKTLIAMPYVLDGKFGRVEIEGRGVRHLLDVQFDEIRNEPAIDHKTTEDGRTDGTTVRLRWSADDGERLAAGDLPCLIAGCERERFLQVAESFAWLNPHLHLVVQWFGEDIEFNATDPAWRKWRSDEPTSPHWYDSGQFRRLLGATLHHHRDGAMPTVRDFVSEFAGLSATAKQKAVVEAVDLGRAPLTALLNGDGFDTARVDRLLAEMKRRTKPVKARRLGMIGREHLVARFKAAGCAMDSFQYASKVDEDAHRPEILEVAFGFCPNGEEERRLISGTNFSPSLRDGFHDLGADRETLGIWLQRLQIEPDDPVIFIMHYSCPRVTYVDRGKSGISMSEEDD